MERSEAIEILKGIPNHIGDDCDGYELKAIRLAIEALEKQIPQKPIKSKAIIGGIKKRGNFYFCPVCAPIERDKQYKERKPTFVGNKYGHLNCCPWCGQAIDWGEE